MKKRLCLLIIALFLLPAGVVHADKEQVAFAVQKAKAFIAKVKSKSEEMKIPAEGLQSAQAFVGQAESTMKGNTSMLGSLKKEAEPDILYYAEMAEISASTILARLEKVGQERENARLEKLIPEIEAKIKIFHDKNAEIQRLTEEANKPKGAMQTYAKEIALLKKDLTDKTKLVEELTAANRRLKEDLKALESQKGSDIVDMRAKMQSANRSAEFFKMVGSFGYPTKWSDRGGNIIVPRKDLLKTTPKGPVLAPGGEAMASRMAELWKSYPETRLKIDVHGFGKPPKSEDQKATSLMAEVLKKDLVARGIKESAIDTVGSGSGLPLYSKSAVEENRRVEITVSR